MQRSDTYFSAASNMAPPLNSTARNFAPRQPWEQINDFQSDMGAMQAPPPNHPPRHLPPGYGQSRHHQVSHAHAQAASPMMQLDIHSTPHATMRIFQPNTLPMTASNVNRTQQPLGHQTHRPAHPPASAQFHQDQAQMGDPRVGQRLGPQRIQPKPAPEAHTNSISTSEMDVATREDYDERPVVTQLAQPTDAFPFKSFADVKRFFKNRPRRRVLVGRPDDVDWVKINVLVLAEQVANAVTLKYAKAPFTEPAVIKWYNSTMTEASDAATTILSRKDGLLTVQGVSVKVVIAMIHLHEQGASPSDIDAALKAKKFEEGITCSERVSRFINSIQYNKLCCKDFVTGNYNQLVLGPYSCAAIKIANMELNENRSTKVADRTRKGQDDNGDGSEEALAFNAGVAAFLPVPKESKRKLEDDDSGPAATQQKPKKAQKSGGGCKGGETNIPAPPVPSADNDVSGVAAGTVYSQYGNLQGPMLGINGGVEAGPAGQGHATFNSPVDSACGGPPASSRTMRSEVQAPAVDPRLQYGSFGAVGYGYGMEAQGGSGGITGLQYGPQSANGLVSSDVDQQFEPASGSLNVDNFASEFGDLVNYENYAMVSNHPVSIARGPTSPY